MSRVKALWDYAAGEANEISFKAGEVFTLVVQHNNDWWEGENAGGRGFFPANRVELLKTDDTPIEPDTKPIAPPPAPVQEVLAAISPAPAQEANGAAAVAPKADNLTTTSKEGSPAESQASTPNSKSRPNSGSGFFGTLRRGRSSIPTTEDGEKLEPPPVSSIRKEGFLSRRAGGGFAIRTWRSMWVEQANNNLYFYKDPQNKKKPEQRDTPSDVVDLKNARVDASGTLDKKKTIFAVVTAKDELITLQASSESEMIGWAKSMCESEGAREEAMGDVMGSKTLNRKHKTLRRKAPGEAAKPKELGGVDEEITAAPEKALADATFGGLLEEQVKKENRKIPILVEICLRVVEEKGLQVPGIYRMSGNISGIQKLRQGFNTDVTKIKWDDPSFADIHVITGALKQYLRELQDPITTFAKYGDFIAAGKIQDPQERAAKIKEIYVTLPEANKAVLVALVAHLRRVARFVEVNKMDAANLSVIFGPTLIRQKTENLENLLNLGFQNAVVETMITQCNQIFL